MQKVLCKGCGGMMGAAAFEDEFARIWVECAELGGTCHCCTAGGPPADHHARARAAGAAFPDEPPAPAAAPRPLVSVVKDPVLESINRLTAAVEASLGAGGTRVPRKRPAAKTAAKRKPAKKSAKRKPAKKAGARGR